jgi:transposase
MLLRKAIGRDLLVSTMHTRPTDREAMRVETLDRWSKDSAIDLARFDTGQRWVIYFALCIVAALGEVLSLRRVLGYFLARSGFELGSQAIAAIIGVSDRSVRNIQSLSPANIVHSIRNPAGGNRKPKLEAHHSGPIAKFLVEHPRARVQDVLQFVAREFDVTMDRLTLRRYIERYGLGCLRGEFIADAPFLSEPLDLAEPSC